MFAQNATKSVITIIISFEASIKASPNPSLMLSNVSLNLPLRLVNELL